MFSPIATPKVCPGERKKNMALAKGRSSPKAGACAAKDIAG